MGPCRRSRAFVDGLQRVASELARPNRSRSGDGCRPDGEGARASVSRSGLPVPMSMPRYTIAESTLMTLDRAIGRRARWQAPSFRWPSDPSGKPGLARNPSEPMARRQPRADARGNRPCDRSPRREESRHLALRPSSRIEVQPEQARRAAHNPSRCAAHGSAPGLGPPHRRGGEPLALAAARANILPTRQAPAWPSAPCLRAQKAER